MKRIAEWLNIHDREIGLLLWTMALLFIVRSSGIVLNNYAETAFLKRYGVEFLPIVNMANAGVTVVVMGLMAGLMVRFPGPGLLGGLFVFCGASIFGIRLLIPLGFDLIYPALFMLKALYEVLLALLFWNLANDLFNTRQSKRLFPLITAGGVVGQILGSFATPWLVRITAFDNLLVIYLGITAIGAVLIRGMMAQYPTLMVSGADAKRSTKGRSSMLSEIRNIAPLMKESPLMWIMIALTFLPNVVIPIMNYQFNYAVDSQFATEAAMIQFFGYFRGILNTISLIILLFVGKIYGRWGLPVALMFHPFNYILAFAAFLFRFDAFSAMYARMSTNIIRTTINIPANAVIMGLFPESYRSLVRPFLRGTVVRIGLFLGSGLILASSALFHPQYLSLVALPFVLAWAATPFFLKRRYASILLDLVSRDQLDLKSLESRDLAQIFSGRAVRAKLVEAFNSAEGSAAVWFGRLLGQLDDRQFASRLMDRIATASAATQVALLGLVKSPAPPSLLQALAPMVASKDMAVAKAALEAIDRAGEPASADLIDDTLMTEADPDIRALAAAIRYRRQPEIHRAIIADWIQDTHPGTQIAGVQAAGRVADGQLAPHVMARLTPDQHPELLPSILEALPALGIDRRNPVVIPFLSHSDARVRRAALSAFTILDKPSLNRVIERLGDKNDAVFDLAVETIAGADYQDGKALVKALDIPNTRLRRGIFALLDRLQIRTPDINRFVDDQIIGAYKCLAERKGLAAATDTAYNQLLMDHLDQERHRIMETVVRVLAAQDTTKQLTVIRRGLTSSDAKQRANSLEALEDLLETRLARIMVPLIDGRSTDQALAVGHRRYRLPRYGKDPVPLLDHLLGLDNRATVLLAAAVAAQQPTHQHHESLTHHPNPEVADLIRCLAGREPNPASGEKNDMAATLTVPDIILRLKRIEIFEGLSVNQLAAIASVTEEESVDAAEIVIRQGDAGDSMYLVIDGETAVIKQQPDGAEVELDRIGPGDYFGEMALIEDIPRSATIRTVSPTRLLLLRKQEFNEMVREYPQIALEICRILGGRIRRLHEKIGRNQRSESPSDDQ